MELKEGQELEFEDGKRYIVRVDGEVSLTTHMPIDCRINRHAMVTPLKSSVCSVFCMPHHYCTHGHLRGYISSPRGIVNLHFASS